MAEQVGELAVAQLPARAIELQQATGTTLGQRVTSDQRLGKVEVEIGNTHDSEGVFLQGGKAYRISTCPTT